MQEKRRRRRMVSVGSREVGLLRDPACSLAHWHRSTVPSNFCIAAVKSGVGLNSDRLRLR